MWVTERLTVRHNDSLRNSASKSHYIFVKSRRTYLFMIFLQKCYKSPVTRWIIFFKVLWIFCEYVNEYNLNGFICRWIFDINVHNIFLGKMLTIKMKVIKLKKIVKKNMNEFRMIWIRGSQKPSDPDCFLPVLLSARISWGWLKNCSI